MRTHNSRVAIVADHVVQSPWSKEMCSVRTMSCRLVPHQQQLPFRDALSPPYVQPHTSTARPPVVQHRTTITVVPYVKWKVPMAVTVVKQRHVQTLVAQKHLDANVWNDLLSCKSASESSSSMSQAFKRQKASKRQSSNERPRASNIP